ncbi:hypothetical protein BCR44DRAFT_1435096 [Catenaria anguillulae PL171]|uniref:Uncharacterized protein n=1 Tax=Catenaria anguillulae PL171 TaxID=765915 RepID=A0A1Y2HKN2_9FUNG|nr:hypothetical protein BCR44DRAFT_1435096 [Catenaria anguillulae PL171]
MLRQLRHKDGPIVAAVMRVMVGYEPAELVAVDATAQEGKVKIEAGCVHGHAPAAWPGSADNVPLMLREWTWRWTAGRKLMDLGVIEDLVRVDFSGLPALAEMQLKVVAKQVARYVDARGSTAADEVLQRLVHVIMTAEHAPREAARVLAVVLGAVAKDHELLEGVLARGLFNAFSTTLDEELLQSSVAAADKQVCPVVYGLVSMLFGSNKTFGLVLHRVFHYAAPDIVSPARAGQVVGISSETVAGAILYTANADVRKASGTLGMVDGVDAVIAVRAELYDYLLFEFFKEFTRLADKRVALDGNDGHARDTGGFGESVTEKEMVSLGIDTLAIAPAILDPASARRPPSQSDWTHATKAAAAALTHLHQRLDHLAVGFTVLYSAWDLQQIDLMLSASGLPAHPSGRVPLVTHIVNVLTMSGTHPETGVSWSFPSPYLLQVLARIGTDASLAFVTIVGHQLADQLGHCDHVPNAIVNAVYKAMYAVLISALQHKQDPAVQVPFTLLVKVFASVLMVDKELWPMWQRAVASVPEMRRDEVTRDMYQELVQQVLGPVEQRAAVDLWWCAVEGIVRRKVPMPV